MAEYAETNVLELVLKEDEFQASAELKQFLDTELYTLGATLMRLDRMVKNEMDCRLKGTSKEPEL